MMHFMEYTSHYFRISLFSSLTEMVLQGKTRSRSRQDFGANPECSRIRQNSGFGYDRIYISIYQSHIINILSN